jgi:hypothetical protein
LYKVATSQWTRKAAKLTNLRDWINKTVAQELMAPTTIKMLNKRQSTPQAMIRILKNDLAPTDSNTTHLVRQQYRAHLKKARTGRINPERWFNEWQVIYGKAQAFQVTEIEGQLALTDFLDALSVRIAPDWARSMRQDIIKDAALGRPTLTIDNLARVFAMQEQASQPIRGRSVLVAATLGDQSDSTTGLGGGNKKKCPCKQNGFHNWDLIKCRRL